jgi:hypothetical protein
VQGLCKACGVHCLRSLQPTESQGRLHEVIKKPTRNRSPHLGRPVLDEANTNHVLDEANTKKQHAVLCTVNKVILVPFTIEVIVGHNFPAPRWLGATSTTVLRAGSRGGFSVGFSRVGRPPRPPRRGTAVLLEKNQRTVPPLEPARSTVVDVDWARILASLLLQTTN